MYQCKLHAAAQLCVLALSASCSAEDPASESSPSYAEEPISWEQFKQYSERRSRIVDDEKIYLVEWDIPVTEAELYEYYVNRFIDTEKSTVDVLNIGGGDNAWAYPAQFSLTYCVSTNFGSNHTRIKNEMERATLAWMQATNVAFVYKPSEDGNCVDANSAVEIPVVPHAGGGACAFFPDPNGRAHCTSHGRALVINIADLDSYPTREINGNYYTNLTTEGALRHELGHILGLRHEQIREADNAVDDFCAIEVNNPGLYRALTDYDKDSAMHYPWCDGSLTSALVVTPLDAQGAMQLYGPPAWYAALDLF